MLGALGDLKNNPSQNLPHVAQKSSGFVYQTYCSGSVRQAPKEHLPRPDPGVRSQIQPVGREGLSKRQTTVVYWSLYTIVLE